MSRIVYTSTALPRPTSASVVISKCGPRPTGGLLWRQGEMASGLTKLYREQVCLYHSVFACVTDASDRQSFCQSTSSIERCAHGSAFTPANNQDTCDGSRMDKDLFVLGVSRALHVNLKNHSEDFQGQGPVSAGLRITGYAPAGSPVKRYRSTLAAACSRCREVCSSPSAHGLGTTGALVWKRHCSNCSADHGAPRVVQHCETRTQCLSLKTTVRPKIFQIDGRPYFGTLL